MLSQESASRIGRVFKALLVNKFFLSFPLSVIFLFLFQVMNELVSCAYALNFIPGTRVNSLLVIIFLPACGPITPLLYGIFSRICNTASEDSTTASSSNNSETAMVTSRSRITTANKNLRWKLTSTILFLVALIPAVVLRLIFPFFQNPVRGSMACISLFFFLMAIPFMLEDTGLHGSNIPEYDVFNISVAMCLALILKMCFTLGGNTIDVTVYPVTAFFIISFILAIFMFIGLGMLIIYRFMIARVLYYKDTQSFLHNRYQIEQMEEEGVEPEIELSSMNKNADSQDFQAENRKVSFSANSMNHPQFATDDELTHDHHSNSHHIDEIFSFFNISEKEKRSKAALVKKANQQPLVLGHFKVFALSLGLMNCFTMLLLTGVNPAPFVRWTDASYYVVHLVLLGSLCAYMIEVMIRKGLDLFPNLRFHVTLILNLLNNIVFTLGAYYSTDTTNDYQLTTYILIIITMLLVPLTIFNQQNMWYELESHSKTRGKVATVAIGFSCGYLLFVLIMFLACFSHNSELISAHRLGNAYWLVPLFGALFSWTPTLLLTPKTYFYGSENPLAGRRLWILKCFRTEDYVEEDVHMDISVTVTERELADLESSVHHWFPKYVLSHVCVLVIAILVIAFLFWGLFSFQSNPNKLPKKENSSVLKVAAYNIHQGYDGEGNRAYPDILASLKRINPDVFALIDSNTCRASNAYEDLLRYISSGMNYRVFTGPVPASGSSGISLLSRYPISNPMVTFAATTDDNAKIPIVSLKLTVEETVWSVIVTMMNRSTRDQTTTIQKILSMVSNEQPSIILGQFNFQSNSNNDTMYHMMTSSFNDAWTESWPSGLDNQGQDGTTYPAFAPVLRETMIFVSQNVTATSATVHTGETMTTYLPFSVDLSS